jgi:drug/metabolite transporter (DMT)-like permease
MTSYKSRLDTIGIFVASLCILHCIALPLLLTTVPLWGFELLENMYIEIATLLTAFFAGGWAIFRGYKKIHRNISIPLLFISGLMLMVVADFLGNEFLEMPVKGIGAVLVITAHVTNWRKCRTHMACASTPGKTAQNDPIEPLKTFL